MSQTPDNDFEKAAAAPQDGSLIAELWGFLKHNKKWWLLPIFCTLLLIGLLIILTSTAVAPFIYTLF